MLKGQLQIAVRELFSLTEFVFEHEAVAVLINSGQKENEKKQADNTAKLLKLQAQEQQKENTQKRLQELEQNLENTTKKQVQQDEELRTIMTKVSETSIRLETLQESLQYDHAKQAQEILQTWKTKLVCLRQALQKAKTVYDQCLLDLKNNETLLTEYKNRLVGILKSKQESEKTYLIMCKECGFNDEQAYKNALLNEAEVRELEVALENYKQEVQSVKQELKRLLEVTKDKEKQDLEVLEQVRTELGQEKGRVVTELEEVTTSLGVNEPLDKRIGMGLTKLATYQKEFLLVSNLAKTASGELPGKQKLAFEQYVQAFYFNQILSEANKRLKIMTNSRYELLRRVNDQDLRSQTGLEIDVLDYYTGRTRSVKSLSGGESFKASLALALGLSDVIQSFAGGVEINTLFVDEGFGALDEESLEQAIQTLVGLAKGNRLIGIISHVSELKERIDRQILVEKTVAGSSLQVI